MHHFNKNNGYILSILFLGLLFLPKINLITFAGRETAGIRLDDIALFCFSILFLWAHIVLKKRIFDIEKVVFLIFITSLLSLLINHFLYSIGSIHVKGSILYAIRVFEYFMFFYIGLIASRYFSLYRVLWIYFWISAFAIILQKFGVIGGFSNYGYTYCTARVIGLSAFPSETGVVLNLLFCYLLYYKKFEFQRFPFVHKEVMRLINTLFPYVFFLFMAILIIMTGSRIAVLAHVVSFLPFLKNIVKTRSIGRIVLVIVAVILSTGFMVRAISNDKYALERSKGLFSLSNLELGKQVWKHIDLKKNPMGNEVVKRSDQDMSWWMRIHKWVYALKIYATHPAVYLQGVGPGFALAGLDGGILRIFVEQGIIGFFLYAKLFMLIAAQSRAMRWCIIVFMINMIFFDVYLAYKAMSILFIMTGFAYAENTAAARVPLRSN